MEKNRTLVEIDGREYPVASVQSVEHILEVAALVDAKVREIRNTSVLNRELALVFAALNLADELVKLRAEPAAAPDAPGPAAEERSESASRRGNRRSGRK